MRSSKEFIRDCVRASMKNGSKCGWEFKTMRHAIVVEMKRVGFTKEEVKEELFNWNEKCERILQGNRAKQQLYDYVDWVWNKDCKVGCKALGDYCIGKEKCDFLAYKEYFNRTLTQNLPFNMDEAEKFLRERYKADSFIMLSVIRALHEWQVTKATGTKILVGFRKIAYLISTKYKTVPNVMTIYRRMQDLIREGFIEQVEKGKRGTFSAQANGYIFLPWTPPRAKV